MVVSSEVLTFSRPLRLEPLQSESVGRSYTPLSTGKMARSISVIVSELLNFEATVLTNNSSEGRARDFHEALWYHLFESSHP